MKNKTKAYSGIVSLALIVTVLLIAVPIQPAKAQFVLSSWSFPDSYGQGIYEVEIWENSTGIWSLVAVSGYAGTSTFDLPAPAFVTIKVASWFNSTLTGASDIADGKNYQRHSISVDLDGSTIFSQQNFTYDYGDDSISPPMWYYGYNVIFDASSSGGVYTATLVYEVYW